MGIPQFLPKYIRAHTANVSPAKNIISPSINTGSLLVTVRFWNEYGCLLSVEKSVAATTIRAIRITKKCLIFSLVPFLDPNAEMIQ